MASSSKIKVLAITCKLGAVSFKQLHRIFNSDFHRVHLYRLLNGLMKKGYIKRVSLPLRIQGAFIATDAGRQIVYGKMSLRDFNTKEQELYHTLAVGNAVIEFSQYSNIKNITVEHELGSAQLNELIVDRRPDAILTVSKNNIATKIALEVELSRKTEERIEKILAAYDVSFSSNLHCKGVVIVVYPNDTYKLYSRLLLKRSKELREKVLLIRPNELIQLKEDTFGKRLAPVTFNVTPMVQSNMHSIIGI